MTNQLVERNENIITSCTTDSMYMFPGYILSMAAQNTNPFTDTLTSENISVQTHQHLYLLWSKAGPLN